MDSAKPGKNSQQARKLQIILKKEALLSKARPQSPASRFFIVFFSLAGAGAAVLLWLVFSIWAQNQTYAQSGYRWFENADSLEPANPLASANASTTLSAKGDAFRLRLLIHVGDEDLATGTEVFKLQYAQKVGATCDTNMASTDESYQDVTPISALAYYDNPSIPDGALALASTTADPAHSGHTNISQTYEEENNFTATATVPAGADGLWDFSLFDRSGSSNTAYCLRVVKSSGALLNSYEYVPEITTASGDPVGGTSRMGSFTFKGNIKMQGSVKFAGSFVCGDPVNFTYLGAPAEYGSVAVGGQCFMDRNLGATQVATSATDYLAYGDLFQWGRLSDGHQVRTSASTSVLSGTNRPGHASFIKTSANPYDWRSPQNNSLWNATATPNNPCPPGWRPPTKDEWVAAINNLGLTGCSSDCLVKLATSTLKLPSAGGRSGISAALSNRGTAGDYWSGSPGGAYAYSLYFSSGDVSPALSGYRAYGLSVRCIHIDTFVCGDPVSFTYRGQEVTYDSVPVGGECFMDRNLGATQVATSATDYLSYGDLFQWGRLSDGHQARTSATTSSLSSSDVPGHASFILAPNSPYDWRSPQNPSLWNATATPNNPCPPGWRPPTKDEWVAAISALGLTTCSSDCLTKLATSTLKLPTAGYRYRTTGAVDFAGSDGYYWSGSPGSSNAYILYFHALFVLPASVDYRAGGLSLRCLKN